MPIIANVAADVDYGGDVKRLTSGLASSLLTSVKGKGFDFAR